MIIRFGYVAMSLNLKNASPSKTMTVKQFEKIPDYSAAIRRLERIAQENLENTIRLLKYNRGEKIYFYRFSSRLIPLAGHILVEDWEYLSPLKLLLAEAGEIIKETNMRVGFHPDHFTLLNSAKEDVFQQSVKIIERHVKLLELMNINPKHRNVLHVGGKTGGKESASKRFVTGFSQIPQELGESLIIENDDKTFTAEETLEICEHIGQPMVLDLHHDFCNPSPHKPEQLWDRILRTWEKSYLPPKIHISSPKSASDIRAHADYIRLEDFLPFVEKIKESIPHLDIMIEAKQKDNALFDLMENLKSVKKLEIINASMLRI